MEKKRKIGGRDEIYGRDDTSAVLKAFSTFSSSLFPHLNDFFPAGSLFSFPLLNRLISLQEFTPKEREREGGRTGKSRLSPLPTAKDGARSTRDSHFCHETARRRLNARWDERSGEGQQ